MKASEIHTRAVYTNGLGRFRIVTGEGWYPLYRGQADADCIEYEAVRVDKKGPVAVAHPYNAHRTPYTHHATRSSFATWAKRLATDEEARMVANVLASAQAPA